MRYGNGGGAAKVRAGDRHRKKGRKKTEKEEEGKRWEREDGGKKEIERRRFEKKDREKPEWKRLIR